jgi:hypothetical protein
MAKIEVPSAGNSNLERDVARTAANDELPPLSRAHSSGRETRVVSPEVTALETEPDIIIRTRKFGSIESPERTTLVVAYTNSDSKLPALLDQYKG